ncbi:toxin-antitoxin system YwqK family antitoxin [Nocardia sp. NPDC004123]
MGAVKRIDRTYDYHQISTGDDLRLEYRGEPFTGEVVTTLGDQLLAQAFYVDGISHGLQRAWWSDGQLKSQGEMDFGTPQGVHREWHRNGRLAKERQFDEMGRLRAVQIWDESGSAVERARPWDKM